jgi:hypothetical protein
VEAVPRNPQLSLLDLFLDLISCFLRHDRTQIISSPV